MTKKDILKTLKSDCRQSIKLPSRLGFEIIKNDLTIEIPIASTLMNMQCDSAAFEGWAIVLKRWINSINRVILKWEEPKFSNISVNNMQHYQRFLFRAKRFSEAFSWVDIHNVNKGCFGILKTCNGEEIILNIPSKKRSRVLKEKKDLNTYSENQLEEFILSDEITSDIFKEKFDLCFVDNQLPVGVFEGVKSNKTKIFTGGKSAIDIWGINNRKEVCIFELKNTKNTKVGALSEMLFYSFILRDIAQGDMRFDSTKYEGLQKIQEAEKINCYLLAPSTHPLIDVKVFSLLNKSTFKIEFGNVRINDSLTFSIL